MLLDGIDVGDLDLELLDAADDIRGTVAAGLGGDIVLVWRQGASSRPVPGGAGVDDYGVRHSTGGETARSDQKPFLVGVYYARIAHNSSGQTQDFGGQMVDVMPHVFTFNESQNPDVKGGDVFTRAKKRRDNLTIAELGWKANTAYPTGAREMSAKLSKMSTPTRRCAYEATKGGVSGEVEPSFPTTEGATVSDGTIIWTCRGRLDEYEVKDPGGRDTIPVERVVGCIEVQS